MSGGFDKHKFPLSGPSHVTAVDWGNAHHRRSVAASLVQGVSVLEHDRQKKRQGPIALSPPWWEFFNFQLIHQLVDVANSSIFGAVYEFKPTCVGSTHSIQKAPKYVIAFRGTITKGDGVSQDLKLDMRLFYNGLYRTPRFEVAMQAVRNVVAACGGSNIWLAGHSLGSAMGMLVGKNVASTGIFLEAFLFNPPFISPPMEGIKYKKLKQCVRITSSLITAGLSVTLKGHHHRLRSDDSFTALSAWTPSLFVHPDDHICSEYIGYFEHRKKLKDIGGSSMVRLATQNSKACLITNVIGRESEPLHLLPSAILTISLRHASGFRQAHGIRQWWMPDMNVQSNLYKY